MATRSYFSTTPIDALLQSTAAPVKTQLGLDELRGRSRTLSQRHRTLLLLVDGQRALSEVLSLAQQAGAQISHFEDLIRMGMVQLPGEVFRSLEHETLPGTLDALRVTSVEVEVSVPPVPPVPPELPQASPPRSGSIAPPQAPAGPVAAADSTEPVWANARPSETSRTTENDARGVREPALDWNLGPLTPRLVQAPDPSLTGRRTANAEARPQASQPALRVAPNPTLAAAPAQPQTPPLPARMPVRPDAEVGGQAVAANRVHRRSPRPAELPLALPAARPAEAARRTVHHSTAATDVGSAQSAEARAKKLDQVRELLFETLRIDSPLFSMRVMIALRDAKTEDELIELVWVIERHLAKGRYSRQEMRNLQHARELLGLGNTVVPGDE